MIFDLRKPAPPVIGTLKYRKSLCLLPVEFHPYVYWMNPVKMTYRWTKDAITVFMDGGGYYKDGWQLIKVEPVTFKEVWR